MLGGSLCRDLCTTSTSLGGVLWPSHPMWGLCARVEREPWGKWATWMRNHAWDRGNSGRTYYKHPLPQSRCAILKHAGANTLDLPSPYSKTGHVAAAGPQAGHQTNRFQTQLCHFPAERPQANHFLSLNYSFLICKVGSGIPTTQWVILRSEQNVPHKTAAIYLCCSINGYCLGDLQVSLRHHLSSPLPNYSHN